jgi:hypothetical protein
LLRQQGEVVLKIDHQAMDGVVGHLPVDPAAIGLRQTSGAAVRAMQMQQAVAGNVAGATADWLRFLGRLADAQARACSALQADAAWSPVHAVTGVAGAMVDEYLQLTARLADRGTVAGRELARLWVPRAEGSPAATPDEA